MAVAHRPLAIRLAALTGVVCISFAAIFVRAADVSPTTTTFFRAAYAIPVLFIAWLVVRSADHRSFDARRMALVAGLVLAFDLTMFHQSIDLIGAGLATVLANTQVLFVGLAAWLVWRERPTRTALWVVPIMLIGVAFISGLGRADTYGDDPVRGVLFGLVAGAAYAVFLLIFRTSNRTYLAPTAGPVLDATVGTAIGGLIAGAAALMLGGDFSLEPAWPAHGWLIALAVVAQAVGWMLIAVALPRLPALETSVMILLQPVLALVWARIFFDEALSSLQVLGVGIVLAGMLVVSVRGTVERRPARQPAAATEG